MDRNGIGASPFRAEHRASLDHQLYRLTKKKRMECQWHPDKKKESKLLENAFETCNIFINIGTVIIAIGIINLCITIFLTETFPYLPTCVLLNPDERVRKVCFL